MYRIRSSDNTVHEVPKHRFTPSKGSAALDDSTYPIGVLCCSAVPHDAAKCRNLHLATVLVTHQGQKGKGQDEAENEKTKKEDKTQTALVTEVPVSSLLDDRGRRAAVGCPLVPRRVCPSQQHCSDPDCCYLHPKISDEAAAVASAVFAAAASALQSFNPATATATVAPAAPLQSRPAAAPIQGCALRARDQEEFQGSNSSTDRTTVAPTPSADSVARTPNFGNETTSPVVSITTPTGMESHLLSALERNPAEAQLRADPTELGVLCTDCRPGFTPTTCMQVHLRAEVLVFGERVRKDDLADTTGKELLLEGSPRDWCDFGSTCDRGRYCRRLHRRSAAASATCGATASSGLPPRGLDTDVRALYHDPHHLLPVECALAGGVGRVEVQSWSGAWSAAPPAVAVEALRAPPETAFQVEVGNGAAAIVDLRSMTMYGLEGDVRSIRFAL